MWSWRVFFLICQILCDIVMTVMSLGFTLRRCSSNFTPGSFLQCFSKTLLCFLSVKVRSERVVLNLWFMFWHVQFFGSFNPVYCFVVGSKKKLCAIYGKWTECLYTVDPAAFDAHKKSDKKSTEDKNDSKRVKKISTSYIHICVYMCI